ncbi:unnamed protein product [Nesidiocoris tenuis]|uniref:Uncharacterized protein n=1 Tax=Nesidiocoris tenuis TaxID=355587 RepID=A0A6H5GC43_9HEMI|nr:unnamed protein product [Nesidiocoris tenuis]
MTSFCKKKRFKPCSLISRALQSKLDPTDSKLIELSFYNGGGGCRYSLMNAAPRTSRISEANPRGRRRILLSKKILRGLQCLESSSHVTQQQIGEEWCRKKCRVQERDATKMMNYRTSVAMLLGTQRSSCVQHTTALYPYQFSNFRRLQ